MAKHTLDNIAVPDPSHPVLSRKPISSGHYRIVNGVEMTSEHPPVVISEKNEKKRKISSGTIPAVLDPALAKRGRTIMGLTAVTMPELPAVVVDQAPVSQEPASSPDTLKSPMRFPKAPLVRKETVLGLDIGAELAKVQEQRTETVRRRKALDEFLDDIDAEPFILQPRNGEVEWFVKMAFASLGFDCSRHSVISVGKAMLAINGSLPDGFRQVALAAIRTRVNDIVTRVPDILWDKGNALSEFSEADRERIMRIGDRIAATLPDEVKSLIDQATVSATYVAATARRATDILENRNGLVIGGFFSLFSQGWIPVGVMDDGDFLVITK